MMWRVHAGDDAIWVINRAEMVARPADSRYAGLLLKLRALASESKTAEEPAMLTTPPQYYELQRIGAKWVAEDNDHRRAVVALAPAPRKLPSEHLAELEAHGYVLIHLTTTHHSTDK